MKARKLYVIGNGFDLWHGIPSSLAEFKQYVQATDPDIYREVEDYLPTQDDWSDLERALADMDVDALIDNLGQFMSSYGAEDWSDAGHHDFPYEVQNAIERLSTGLRLRFAEWIRKLPIPTPITTQKRLAALSNDAVFFSFNYTNTLGSLYGVLPEKILFIHGCTEVADGDFVLGHAWHPQTRRSLNDRPDIEDMDTRLMEANDIIDEYFSATFKHSADLIAQHRGFFDALTEIEQVIVLGHSLSDIDAAYFTALLEQRSVAEAAWLIACRSLDEWTEKQLLLTKLGINPSKAFPVTWDSGCL
ncbi:MAG TPA: bacteriophage abortive infection AbiH family protein [Rhodocyclaceae bacterium]